MLDIHPGSRVRLEVPENPRLHRAQATVEQIAPWGAHVRTSAAATGSFRALWQEMEPETHSHSSSNRNGTTQAQATLEPRSQGYTGDMCDTCGSCKLRRSGSCAVCEDCGSTSGCS